ncbi:hypothetical protein Mucpa_0259 [Mucilaginibacter paludis DSM 18603]|uniref:Uncharacterized protein n=1 Tax=Mucilaginibacter paludis DSM 18603 TaxID=714943 RepID=H1YFQ5_9SPHI|nr:hypothetical protein Mucpa_0259 [Mucilaginibacter paludis DSM 18603]
MVEIASALNTIDVKEPLFFCSIIETQWHKKETTAMCCFLQYSNPTSTRTNF